VALLALEEVHASYGSTRALYGVNLEARAGEVVPLPGRNGAGKSTTLKSIVALVDVTRVAEEGGGDWSVARVYEFFPRLAEMARRRRGSLSGGEQQMLTVVRTLMGNPRLLLLDEPSEGLAPIVVKALADQVRALKRAGLTMLLSEQNLAFAGPLADRAYVIERGEIRVEGPMAGLLADEALPRAHLSV